MTISIDETEFKDFTRQQLLELYDQSWMQHENLLIKICNILDIDYLSSNEASILEEISLVKNR